MMHIRKNNTNPIIKYLLLLILSYQTALFASTTSAIPSTSTSYIPQTYQLIKQAKVLDKPTGKVVATWNSKIRFTSREQRGEWIKVSGTFPKDQWTPKTNPLWINKRYATAFKPKSNSLASGRSKNISRRIIINKSNFMLKVFEIKEGAETEEEVYSTQVALGMDRCLSKAKGGKCYFTDPGLYKIRWKIHDPRGIEWCIPKSMEKEFKSDIDAGNRCFRGSIGNYALNIGKSYAIHGTLNIPSLGTKASHGCVRTANADIEHIFKMMDVGDRVEIVE